MQITGERTYEIKTLGCKANLLDSQLLEAELQRQGWKPIQKGDPLSLCIVNSCSVTDEADRQSRKMAARLSREHPQATVVVTGCSAEIDPERLTRSKGIHYVIGNRDKPKLVDLITKKMSEETEAVSLETGKILGVAQSYEQILSRHPMDREWPGPSVGFATPATNTRKTRAFLKIQEGCNSFCTYCIIPYGRGPSRSVSPDQVVDQIRVLTEKQGTREVVITGTNIGDYAWESSGKGFDLAALLERIFSRTKIERLRVSSLDPVEITPAILELMRSEPRFCPHFHVSLQSPHSRVLKLMKRKYGFEEVRRCLESIAGIPREVFVGMDVIAGFPGESAEDFEWSLNALKDLPWTRLHVFPYSERAGTPATRLPGSVRQEERIARARALNELSLKRISSHHERVLASGNVLKEVLLERAHRDSVTGYTPNYVRVRIAESEASVNLWNQLVCVQPKGLEVDHASGEATLLAELSF